MKKEGLTQDEIELQFIQENPDAEPIITCECLDSIGLRLMLHRICSNTTWDSACRDIQRCFEEQKGRVASNALYMYMFPETVTEYKIWKNTEDERYLYPALERECYVLLQEMEQKKKLSSQYIEKDRMFISMFMDAWRKQELFPGKQEPQQGNNIQTTSKRDLPNELNTEQKDSGISSNLLLPITSPKKRGRPSKPFDDILVTNRETIKSKLHSLIDGKQDSKAVIYIKAAIQLGIIQKPTYTQFINEFGNIVSKQIFNKYLSANAYSDDELKGAKQALTNE